MARYQDSGLAMIANGHAVPAISKQIHRVEGLGFHVWIWSTLGDGWTAGCQAAELNWTASKPPLTTRFMGPTWGPPGADRTQVAPMLAPWTLLSGSIRTIQGYCSMVVLGHCPPGQSPPRTLPTRILPTQVSIINSRLTRFRICICHSTVDILMPTVYMKDKSIKVKWIFLTTHQIESSIKMQKCVLYDCDLTNWNCDLKEYKSLLWEMEIQSTQVCLKSIPLKRNLMAW